MEKNDLFTGNSSNFWSKHSVPRQVIQTFIATDKRTKATQKHIGENHSTEFVSLG